MIITDFYFRRENWHLKPIHLQDLNLLVGPNAVGKTKTINSILRVAEAISGKTILNPSSSFITKISLIDGNVLYQYEFSVTRGNINNESLIVAGRYLIERDEDKSSFYEQEVNPPKTRLLLGSVRDTEKYPEAEKLITFFENVSLFSFSNISPGERVLDPIMAGGRDIAGFFNDLSSEDKRTIINLLNDLGFKIGNLRTLKAMHNTLLTMKEEGVGVEILLWGFSTGLIRVVALLTYLFYLSSHKKGGLILVDDLGEGLDYYRSTELGRYVCEFCDSRDIQLIITTNDSFLMNVIDIDNWLILERNGTIVNSIDSTTYPELFQKFKMTGLSNFDLFKSDFIERNK